MVNPKCLCLGAVQKKNNNNNKSFLIFFKLTYWDPGSDCGRAYIFSKCSSILSLQVPPLPSVSQRLTPDRTFKTNTTNAHTCPWPLKQCASSHAPQPNKCVRALGSMVGRPSHHKNNNQRKEKIQTIIRNNQAPGPPSPCFQIAPLRHAGGARALQLGRPSRLPLPGLPPPVLKLGWQNLLPPLAARPRED